jgi:hypothetical protein
MRMYIFNTDTTGLCFSPSMVFRIKPIVNFATNSYILEEVRVL